MVKLSLVTALTFIILQLEHAETRRELAQAYLEHSRADHRSVLNRKQIIEARKEFIESESRAKASLTIHEHTTPSNYTEHMTHYCCVHVYSSQKALQILLFICYM